MTLCSVVLQKTMEHWERNIVRALDSLSMSYTGLRGVNNGKEFEGGASALDALEL
jgi:hypothetical protein